MTDKCRAEFEKQYRNWPKRKDGSYFDYEVQSAWSTWQDAWKAFQSVSPSFTDTEWLNLFRLVANGSWTPEVALQHLKEDVPHVVSAAPINQAYEG